VSNTGPVSVFKRKVEWHPPSEGQQKELPSVAGPVIFLNTSRWTQSKTLIPLCVMYHRQGDPLGISI